MKNINDDHIDRLVNLENNWDGHGGIPVFKEIGEKAKIVLEKIKYEVDDIVANPHGTITIEWRNSNQEILSLEIGLTTYSYFTTENDNYPKCVNGTDVIDIEKLELDIKNILIK